MSPKPLLDAFLSEDCDPDFATEILAEIADCEGKDVLRSYTSNRFNLYLNFESNRVLIEDDIGFAEEGELEISLAEFKAALLSRIG